MAKGRPFSHTAAWKAGACALMLLVASAVRAAPGDPLGPVQRVGNAPHTAEAGLQLARAASGAYAATWFDGGYGSVPAGVYARAFAADGQPRGPAFLVDPSRVYNGSSRVFMDAGGRFLVAWATRESVLGRHFAEDGAPMGPTFQLAARTPFGLADFWDLAMAPDGRYVLLMERWLAGPERLNTVTLHRFEADGRAKLLLPAVIRMDYGLWLQGIIDQKVFATLSRLHGYTKLALDEKGEIVLISLVENEATYDRKFGLGPYRLYGGSIQMRRIGPGGLPLGGTVEVASFNTRGDDDSRYQQNPQIARTPDGRIAVAWMQPGEGLKLRRYSATLKASGAAVLVSGSAQQDLAFSLSQSADGKAALAWTESPNPSVPTSLKSVHAQLYGDSNQPLGSQISGPGNATDSYQQPRLAMDALGNFVLGWQALLRPPGMQGENVGLLQRYSGL